MKYSVYQEMSQLASGRKELHQMMLIEVKSKIDTLVESAPEKNKKIVSKMMDTAYDKIAALGNGMLFNFFADDDISTDNFIRYLDDILKGDL